jgi:alkanesulfonate monooxygenase SsuD/methylene tetrahydromethanopterin reductase-like flavin-dependent oxidoreductase (luciferase family)
VPDRKVVFGAGLGAWNGVDVGNAAESARLVEQADRAGLDLFTLADHPYFGEKLDAYAMLSFLLGRTEHISGAVTVTVTNLPCRPAPVLARTITSLSALSIGRVVLGIGAGGLWDMIVKLGVPRLDGESAVRAMEEAIMLIRALAGGGEQVTVDGQFYQVYESRPCIDDAAAAAGRSPAEVATIFNFGGRITPEPLAATRADDGRWIGGSIAQWIDELTGAVLEHHERLGLPQHRRHPGQRGAGALGRGNSPGRPRSRRRVGRRNTGQPKVVGRPERSRSKDWRWFRATTGSRRCRTMGCFCVQLCYLCRVRDPIRRLGGSAAWAGQTRGRHRARAFVPSRSHRRRRVRRHRNGRCPSASGHRGFPRHRQG